MYNRLYFSVVSGDEEYSAAWKPRTDFLEIIVSPDMLAHHFPDALLDALEQLIDRKYEPTTVVHVIEEKVDRRLDIPC